ncbi:hypothetical protein [Ruegeria marina]|uniref:Uncharacterized protein n=1 Tax=Ruegeria marina TaxID=639004 RepID=A0A1G6NHU5_9RHOB|nr:hypothetical protein [Ruegeria marina]SDC66857.1 hypothetical protein SAMN04488239_103120 [Ruegeria marina]
MALRSVRFLLERNTEDLFGTAPRELRVAGLSSHVQAPIWGQVCRLDEPEMPTRDGYWLTWPADPPGGRRLRALVESFHEAPSE